MRIQGPLPHHNGTEKAIIPRERFPSPRRRYRPRIFGYPCSALCKGPESMQLESIRDQCTILAVIRTATYQIVRRSGRRYPQGSTHPSEPWIRWLWHRPTYQRAVRATTPLIDLKNGHRIHIPSRPRNYGFLAFDHFPEWYSWWGNGRIPHASCNGSPILVVSQW